MRRLGSEIISISFIVCMLCATFNVVLVKGWSNGGFSDDPNNPVYGTHDWIAQHALDWLPTQEKQYILNNLTAYLYGTELPDNSAAADGIGDTVNHHFYYWSNESVQDDIAAVRASEEYSEALSLLQSGDSANASKTAGIMSHYIVDVTVFGHVMGVETDWGTEVHHSDYEDYVNLRTSSYSDEFNTYLSFDGDLRVISAYNATKELAYDTTFDVDGDLTCLWMDQNYNWSDPTFKDRAGESLNLAVNYLADVLHTLYEEAHAPPRRVKNINTDLNYTTIQDAIDAPETLDGHTIIAASGIYYEHVIVNKTVLLTGESNTTIDGYSIGTVIKATADNVNISGLTVQNSGIGSCAILAEGSNGTNINGNTVKNSTYGIRLTNSNNSMLENNNVTSNECGIFIDSCDNNIIIGNMISNNTLGISIDSGNNNLIHHNSFINNDAQANATESFNIWNDNYPSGGNYWSDYAGIDVCSGPYQNETGSDGIGDTQYNIGTTGRQDRYPLINPRIPQHDVAITTLYPLKTAVGQGFLMSVVLSVQNEGDYFEAVNITLTFPTFGHTIVIAGECCLNFNVTLNTTGVTMGNYTVTACISAASGETDVGDNNFTCIMCITLPGDVSGDFKVGPYDFALLATAYGATPGKPKWNPNCDINNDNKVGPADFAQLSVHYGRHYP